MDGWRPHIESALCLSLSDMMKRGSIAPNCITLGGAWAWWREGERIASVRYSASLMSMDGKLTLNYEAKGQPVECVIRLSTVENHYGGRNWFMHCPATGRRARKLYKWEPLWYFCHREAVRPRPTYACQRVGGQERIISQRWELRRRMGDDWSDLFGGPFKPKWMRWKTFERYAARDAVLEDREAPAWVNALARLGVDLKNGG